VSEQEPTSPAAAGDDADPSAGADEAAATGASRSRRLFRRRRPDPPEAPAPEGAPEEAASTEDPAPQEPGHGSLARGRRSLERERRRLTREREDLQFHLGGLALELCRRGVAVHDALRARADELLDLDERVRLVDWRLEALEAERRHRRGGPPPPAGNCLSCGVEFAPGAVFCSNCGARFAPDTAAEVEQTMEISFSEARRP
jgi:hypothetical protein